MMSDEKVEELTHAAETIYKFCDKDRGFFSGIVTSSTGRKFESWNSYTGAQRVLEQKLERKLNRAEITILALAVGFGPTPYLTTAMRTEALETLWSRHPETRQPGCYRQMMEVLTSFY